MGLTEQASLDDPLRQAADLAHISAHFPIMWRIPVIGRALSLVQRAIRIGLRWYINPIVDQINDFNEATITALNTIVARQEALAARVAAMELGVGPTPPAPFPYGEGDAVGAHSRAPSGQDTPSEHDAPTTENVETPLSRKAGEGAIS